MRVRGAKAIVGEPGTNIKDRVGEEENKKPGRSWSSAEWTMLGVCLLMLVVFMVIPTPTRNYALIKRENEPHPYPLFSAEQMEDRSLSSKKKVKTIAWAVTISKG
jgi:hypothetical protein